MNKMRTKEPNILKQLVGSGQIKFFLYNSEMHFTAFAQNDDGLFLLMAKKDGSFDNRILLAREQGALAWGKELFEYYRKDAVPINDWEQLDRLLVRKEKRKNRIAELNGTH
ncbi:MAG: transcriptional regulator FilR1 domain-containing protein [Methanolobus sp.]|nr:transcriptional regulator FilR1 domain-containing protein [Methanolobus sp.]